MNTPRYRVGLLATHPIQYYSPWYQALAAEVDLDVFFSHRQTPEGQAAAGFGVSFDWDVPVVSGFRSTFLHNVARQPDVSHFWGCNTPEIAGIIRDRHFDAFIVHGWGTRSYWQAMNACWQTSTPVLVRGDSHLATPRGTWWRALKAPFYRWFIRKFDAYLVVGSRSREYLQHYGADPARCFSSPHAVDNAFFASRAGALRHDQRSLRREFDLPENAAVFLFVGKFIEGKEPIGFVAAVARASASAPNIVGLMVGDGPLRAGAELSAKTLGAPVRFTGFLNQTEVVKAYAASDVLVVPSLHETWGLTVNEAMACGLPAIVSDAVGCAPDLVLPGVTGETFPAGDVAALTAKMLALAADTEGRSHLSAAAAAHVRNYDVAAAVAGTLQAVRHVTSSPNHTRAGTTESPLRGLVR